MFCYIRLLIFFRMQLVCSTLNPIQGFMENHMHSRPSVKHVLGVLEWSYVVPEKKLFFIKIKNWFGLTPPRFGIRPDLLFDFFLQPSLICMCCQEGSNNDKVSNGNNDKGEPIEMENPPINQDHLIHLKKAVDCEVGDFSTFLRVFHLSIFSSSLLSLSAFLSPPICKIHQDLVEYLNI